MEKELFIQAPATIANLVCGFDVLGMAVREPYDELLMRILPEKKVMLINQTPYDLPLVPEQNVAGVALLELMKSDKVTCGFEVKFTRKIKPGSGLGSSAGSAAGVVAGANVLLGNIFSREELVGFAMKGEVLASGAEHADNIAPCLYGGITLVRSHKPLDIIPLESPDLFVTIVHPEIELKTADSRSVLKSRVLLSDAIRQWANVSALVAGILKKDHSLISRSLEDVIIEPARSILIPEFSRLKSAALAAGALGGGISGSGPSVFMLSSEEPTAKKIELAFSQIYTEAKIKFNSYVTTISSAGVVCKSIAPGSVSTF